MSKKKLLGILLFLSAAPMLFYGCAGGPRTVSYPAIGGPVTVPGGPVQPMAAPQDMYHEVGPGETLSRISKMYGVDVNTLMRVNGVVDPNRIKNGQRLLIPKAQVQRPVIILYPNPRWRYIIIHHTATDVGNARSIDRMHHNRGFWNGLGYHFLIDNGSEGKRNGWIEISPRWLKQQVGAHTKANGMNEIGIGVAVVGNYSETHMSMEMFDSLIYLVRTLQSFYHIPRENVLGHGDVPGAQTECPGALFPWREFKSRLLP